MNHVIAFYRCEDTIDGPLVKDVASPRDIADFVFRETQRSILEETELFALDEWTLGDKHYHVYFEVFDLKWFEFHIDDIICLVSRDFGVPVEQLQNISPLLE